MTRLKEQVDRLTAEKDDLNQLKQSLEEVNKKNQKQMREMREELGDIQKRELEALQKKKEFVSL